MVLCKKSDLRLLHTAYRVGLVTEKNEFPFFDSVSKRS